MSNPLVHFTLVDDNFPESVVDCNDWVEKFGNVLDRIPKNNCARVAVIANKNMHTISFILAVSQLNIPYVPCDPQVPFSRTETVLKQVEPSIYFIQKTVIDRKSDFVKALNVVWESNSFMIARAHQESNLEHPKNLDFILFTSGSTGSPKGVMISKENKNCFVNWAIQQFDINKNSHILSVAPLHFDLSVFDLYASQKTGCTLFLPLQNALMNPLYLAEFISIYKINTIYATPTWFNLLMQFGKLARFDFSFVKTLLLAGEALPVKMVEELYSHFPNATISNLYGPTETNVCSFYTLNRQEIAQQNGVVSIGKACSYAKLSVNAQNVLEVAGQSVMLGYWPTLFEHEKYNTGDLVEYDAASGNYFYVQRVDRMIKRNGFRIEPAEIEMALVNHPLINQAAVVATILDQKVEIIAHYVANAIIEANDLHQFCLNRLPAYMQPDKFLVHSQLPVTSSGKIDYKSLSEFK